LESDQGVFEGVKSNRRKFAKKVVKAYCLEDCVQESDFVKLIQVIEDRNRLTGC